MNVHTETSTRRSRWLDWQPRILTQSPAVGPSKPTKLGSDGFEGSYLVESPKIGDETDAAQGAVDVLNNAGVRIMRIYDGTAIGVWSDLDGLEIRAALRTLEMDCLPVRHLDEDDIPNKYKYRKLDERSNVRVTRSEKEKERA